jgi:hypothetical protein
MRGLLATITVAFVSSAPLGCSERPAPRAVNSQGAATAQEDASASTEMHLAGGQQPAEPESMDPAEQAGALDIEPSDGQTVHHHHYFGLRPPGRLTPSQYDPTNRVIHWPPLLRDKAFSDVRYQLDRLFDERTPDNSGLNTENYNQIKRQCDAMLGILARMIDQLNAEEFVVACGFIKALQDESRFPPE